MADEPKPTTPEPPHSVAAVNKPPHKPVKPAPKPKPTPDEPPKPADPPKPAPRKSFFEQAAEDLEREWGMRE